MKIIRRFDANYIGACAIRQIEETGELCNMPGVSGAEVDRVDDDICLNTKNTKKNTRCLFHQHEKQRSITDTNRHLQFLRAMLNYAVANSWLETNPFKLAGGAGSKLIERSAESRGERFPTFGEKLALIQSCAREGVRGNAHLRSILIVAADTGLRKNELLTLTVSDLDFNERVIRLRAINAKTNRKCGIPMTARVQSELQKLSAEKKDDDFVFDDVGDFKRSFGTLKRAAGIDGLNFHNFRHAFVSRSILAGVPPAIVLKASGHASEEWKRYLNVTPEQLRRLLDPVGEQTAEEVKEFARSVMKGLRDAMQYDELDDTSQLIARSALPPCIPAP
jgi:integrase